MHKRLGQVLVALVMGALLFGVIGLHAAPAYAQGTKIFVPLALTNNAGSGNDLVGGAVSSPNVGVDWSQCRNDDAGGSPISGGTANDGVQDPCEWTDGALGSNNSIYY